MNIPVSVTPAHGGPTPTFGLSGPLQESSALQATFTVALTPLNGFPQNDSVNGLVSLSVDPWTSSFVTAAVVQPSSTVPGSFQVTVAMAPGVTAHYGNVYCAIIDATWNSITQQETLCLNALGNTNFAVPASSQVITVPQGGSTTVYASVNNNVTPTVSQSVSCAAGVSPCNASAIVGAASNGVVTMTINAGGLAAGTTFTQTVTADARSQHLPITVCDPDLDCPSGPATIISNDSPVTYNDGSVSSPFSFSCYDCSLNQSVVSCAVPSGSISVGFYGGLGPNGTDFSLTFQASSGIATGNYALYCQLAPGGSVLAAYVQVQSASSRSISISSVSQSATQALYPGAIAAANGVPIVITGNNFAASPGAVTICPHNASQTQPCGSSGVSASVTNTTGSSTAAWGNNQIYALLTAFTSAPLGSYDVWVTASAQASAVYRNGTAVVAINIQLTQVGLTVISTDGNYTEDTTIKVAAVAAPPSGAAVTNFTGTVNIAEDLSEAGYVQIYSQNTANGASLPAMATISSGGSTTIKASSLAGPQSQSTPNNAILQSTNYPVYGQELSIPQWVVSYPPVDPKAATGANQPFDWMEHMILDIRNGAAGDTNYSTVLNSMTSYTIGLIGYSGLTYGTVTTINPYIFSATRLNTPLTGIVTCGLTQGKDLTNTLAHESRHAYQEVLANMPGNDKDLDFLVNNIPIAPTNIFFDSKDMRPVCETTGFTQTSKAYKGDDGGANSKDQYLAPDFASWAIEYDAYLFASMHDH